ncbi:retrovirus-related pol polyprotein from transposon TNT 1-94 [Tanacetum coccineum]
MTLDIHNWSSFVHQEIQKIVKDEIFPIVNQVDARVQNFEIQFLKEAAKFVRDFQSLAKEADESLTKHKSLEWEIERLLRAVVSQDIMSIVQNNSVVDTSNLQTELELQKSKECKYDKISYDKAYNDMQQKIERLQAQLGDQKGKSKDTPCVSVTLDPFPQKLENENVPQKVDKTNDLSNPVTSNSVPTTKESKVVENDKVIAPGMFRINPFKNSREEKSMPNKPIKASIRTNPIIVPQPHVTTKKVPRSNTNNDRVPSESKSSPIKNKEVEVEEHPRNLLLSKNKKHMSSECNNVKLAIQNDKSEIVCAINKRQMSLNFDKLNEPICLLVRTNKLRFSERLASPKPSKPRMCLRWSPTGKMFAIKGKLIVSIESNANNECFGDLQWGNILITRVYFVEGLWHNLYSDGQFCDSDLEVAFRRNTCFVRNLEGVDLLKANRTTNLYTINLYDMAYASPICLMARATSTKSWLWHQRLSHLNFDTINDLARNDLVTDLPKFKYHKEHLCPSCEQGKSKGHLTHPNLFLILSRGYTFFIWICVVQRELHA